MANYPRTWVEIDLNNIKHNVGEIKKLIPKETLFMAVVKANGYGHGAIEVAKAALESGAQRLGVAILDEAKALRQAGITAPIHLLTGFEPSVAKDVAELGLIPSIFTDEHLDKLKATGQAVKAHIKIDTGMGRIGLNPDDLTEFIAKAKTNQNLEIEGIFSHFATADKNNSHYAQKQLSRFTHAIGELAKQGFNFPIKHIANSAATIIQPSSHLSMVRIGIALYGLQPSRDSLAKIKLKPALSWHARLAHVKTLPAGRSISYGATHKTTKDSHIGTVPVGYADGFNRGLSNNCQVLVNGALVKQIGRICMDQFMVDLTGCQAKTGDKVTLIGCQGDLCVQADDLAKKLNTINYEIVCAISPRVPRVYVGG